jgi:L-asparaginase
MMKFKIFSVGGTIDKVYFDELSDYQVGGPSIRHILNNLPLNFEYEIVSLIRKDSLDMTDEDRELVYHAVEEDPHHRILITHGTDTMIETAKRLLDLKDKVIVLTGAMEPAGFMTSDAVFNVGCAIGAIQSLANGVYIAMNGCIFNPNNVRKNRAAGRFEALNTKMEDK